MLKVKHLKYLKYLKHAKHLKHAKTVVTTVHNHYGTIVSWKEKQEAKSEQNEAIEKLLQKRNTTLNATKFYATADNVLNTISKENVNTPKKSFN